MPILRTSLCVRYFSFCCFFFNDTATTEIYTLSLHDALPICNGETGILCPDGDVDALANALRSEEHTSELQSHSELVCRLLLEKKKKYNESQQQINKNKKTTLKVTKLND